MKAILPAVVLVLLGSAAGQGTAAADGGGDACQIRWQRSLDDALALARAERRPLLVAMNMDGESASERIVRELYRDPGFVALTRRCVCVVGSVFRHSPRDFDGQGRRIPCPRLGEVTCGEHIALEPALYDAYLSDGERVAPRHALILPGGEKAWDLSLVFDLREIERHLAHSLGGGVPAWAAWAARRDQRGRAGLESALAVTDDPDELATALQALQAHGDAGTLGALRVLCHKLPALAPALRQRLVEVARALELESEVADCLRQQVRALHGGQPAGPVAVAALPLLASLDGGAAATRDLLLACRAFGHYGDAAGAAVHRALGTEAAAGVGEAGAFSLRAALALAARVTAAARAAGETLPRPRSSGDEMPPADELERRLREVDARLRQEPEDAEALAILGKASLDLARPRIEAREAGAELLLEDAARALQRALEHEPGRYEWWIERARTAYFQGRFDDEAACGRRAWTIATGRDDVPAATAMATAPGDGAADGGTAALLEDPRALEALRWIGDGDVRALGEGAELTPARRVATIVEGTRALALVAASPFGDATDWTSFASACGAVGLPAEELAVLRRGALRLPADADLRRMLNGLLWSAGRIDRAADEAERIVRRRPEVAAARWFAGYAWMLVAESHRRCEAPARALAAYDTARARMAEAAELREDYAESCRHYGAQAWLGSGMAHLLAGRRSDAAECLVRAVDTDPDVASATDGLGRDVLDLVDGILEWRESGPSPVDAMALLDRLEAADPERAFWAVAVSDSELREALRADGRNPERIERDTVDAGGNPIRMPMGLPTAAGDRYLRASIAAGRRALARSSAAEDRRPLAQADTIWAERMLQRGRLDGVREALAEAAPLLGFAPPPPDADRDELARLADRLRAELGEARPRLRPGR